MTGKDVIESKPFSEILTDQFEKPAYGAVFVTAYKWDDAGVSEASRNSIREWVEGKALSDMALLHVLKDPQIPLDVKANIMMGPNTNGAINHFAYLTQRLEESIPLSFDSSLQNQKQSGKTMAQQSNLTTSSADYTEFVALHALPFSELLDLLGADKNPSQLPEKYEGTFKKNQSVYMLTRFVYDNAKVLFLSSFPFVYNRLCELKKVCGEPALTQDERSEFIQSNIRSILGEPSVDHQDLKDRLSNLCQAQNEERILI